MTTLVLLELPDAGDPYVGTITAPSHLFLEQALADGVVTAPSYTATALTFFVPLEARPILLGPAADQPELRPVLAIGHAAWVAARRHGLEIGRARLELDKAAVRYALSPSLSRARAEVVELGDMAEAWVAANTRYARELTR